MPDIRYLGSTHWTRSILDDEGKWKKFENVAPGEVFSADGDLADRLLSGPRFNRLFVQAGSNEDPNSDDYVRTRQLGEGGMYVADDANTEFGEVTPQGVPFRTVDDNDEQYAIAGPTNADNAALVEEDEIQAEADKARERARESRSSKRASGDGGAATRSQSTLPPSPTSRSGSEKAGRQG